MADAALRDAAIFADPIRRAWAPPSGKRISLENSVALFMALDLLALVASGFASAALFARFDRLWSDLVNDLAAIVGLSAALYLLLSHGIGAYRIRKILELGPSLRRLLAALSATFLVLLVIGAATKTTQNFSRGWFFLWIALACSAAPAIRLALIRDRSRRLATGDFVYRALSVGIFAKPLASGEIAAASRGLAQTAQEIELSGPDELAGLADWIARAEIDQIYIVTPWAKAPDVLQQLLLLRRFSAEIFVLPEDASIRAHQLGVGMIRDRVALRAADRPIDGWSLFAKRAQDVVVSALALVVFAPVILLVALAVRLDSPGPVLFRQMRVGFNGRAFQVLKFRSMRPQATDLHACRQTVRGDDRVTRVGRFIRRTSLDELPQLINVLRGEMSIVGPRPHALRTRAAGRDLTEIADQYAARHRVKPGMTGLAQVSGYRGELDSSAKVVKRVEFDIHYIETWSTWLDLRIILRTAALVLFDRAAY